MPRRSEPAKKIDERAFAVRIRVAIPEMGLKNINEIHAWLRARVGGEFAIHPSATSQGDCCFLYMNDTAMALECVKHFGLRVYGLPKETP